MHEALVFAIEEFSVFDGPGIRTSVFLMGCPLRCEWCHNPEGQSFENSILRSPNGCLGCGACEREAVLDKGVRVYTEQSKKLCPRGLLRHAAVRYTPEALCVRLAKNFAILNAADGGVTFSGGEPTASPDFLTETLSLLQGRVHRAVQTCGYTSRNVFEKVLSLTDYMLFDIKIVNNSLHKRYTGVENGDILANFAYLAQSGKTFVVRTPLIPAVTDTEENLRAIAALLAKNGVERIELLPYNRMAGAKYPLAGKKYTPSFDGTKAPELRTELFAAYGIQAKII